jgi:hypothetical protein
MVNSVSSSSPVAQQYVQNQHPTKPPAKPKQAEQQDTVVLSHKAQGGDQDHDGDSH